MNIENIFNQLFENEKNWFYSKIKIQNFLWKWKNVEGEISQPEKIFWYLSEELSDLLEKGSKIEVEISRKKTDFHEPIFFENISSIENWNHKKLFMFAPERIDFSVSRLSHYCASDVKDFQKYILLTNYKMHMDIFLDRFQNDDIAYSTRECQMPVIHLKRPWNEGITIINIWVWPTNTKNITDHLAILRPKMFLMIWHCWGLRKNQDIWDFVLADKFVSDSSIIEKIYSRKYYIPTVPTTLLNMMIIKNLEQEKLNYRIWTVFTTEDRNRELELTKYKNFFLEDRSIWIDMESWVICLQGFKYKIPNATLLMVSDKPLHWSPKEESLAQKFYLDTKEKHIWIAINVVNQIKKEFEKWIISHREFSPKFSKDDSFLR